MNQLWQVKTNPTLANVISALECADLAARRRRDLVSAVHTTARLLNRNVAELTADMAALRERLAGIHHVQAGMSSKRLANVKSDLAAALRVAAAATPKPAQKVVRSPAWNAFLGSLNPPWERHCLTRLANYCSANVLPPSDVDDQVMERFRDHLAEASLAKDPDKTWKRTTQAWNRCVKRAGLNLAVLSTPKNARHRAIALAQFPASFQADLEAWIKRLSNPEFWTGEGPTKPLRPVSIRNVRATIRQFSSALVARGCPIEEITSLATLVEFDAYKDGLRFFLERNGNSPPTWLSGMAATLLAIARYHVKLPLEETEKLKTIKGRLKVDRPGLTDKNKQRLAQFDDQYNVELLMLLPRRLVDRAEQSKTKSSRMALDVMHAVAIEILLAVPMRSGNLARLDVERHFKWHGQGNAQTVSLAIPASEVKNWQPIEADFSKDTTRLIRTYLKFYRQLVSDHPGDWLFPRRRGGPRSDHLADNLCKVIYRETGVVMNAHLFRHLAGKLYLQQRPGAYEAVRRILGHRKLGTTTSFYTDLETKGAIRHYDEVVLSKRGKS
jgi:integrase